jgi:N-acetylglutamate synthase-like GNAT family acetyltransferase
MLIRKLNSENEKELSAAVKLVQNTHWGVKYSQDQLLLAFRNSDSYVAMIDGEVIGFVRILSDQLYMSYIFDMVIKESLRNKSLGGEFIQQIFAMEKYQNTVWFLTSSDAQIFYEKFGFTALKNSEEKLMFCARHGLGL